MRFSTENETGETTQSDGVDQSPALPHCPPYEYENRALPKNSSPKNQDHFEIVARATNDAVRDWDVNTGLLSWPQGFESLLGYDLAATNGDIGFWQTNVHPEDRIRVAEAIRDAIVTHDEHWSA